MNIGFEVVQIVFLIRMNAKTSRPTRSAVRSSLMNTSIQPRHIIQTTFVLSYSLNIFNHSDVYTA